MTTKTSKTFSRFIAHDLLNGGFNVYEDKVVVAANGVTVLATEVTRTGAGLTMEAAQALLASLGGSVGAS